MTFRTPYLSRNGQLGSLTVDDQRCQVALSISSIITECSLGVRRVPWEHEAAGSTPVIPTIFGNWYSGRMGRLDRSDAGSIPAFPTMSVVDLYGIPVVALIGFSTDQ